MFVAIIVRRGKIRSVAEDIRKGLAEELGVDVLDINLSAIEELVYKVVDAYSTLILKNQSGVDAGRILGKMIKSYIKYISSKKTTESETSVEKPKEAEEEKPEEKKEEKEFLSEEEIESILKQQEG